jgi:HEAT repeat protein
MKTFLIFVFLISAAVTMGCSRTERGPLLAGGREVSSWVKELNDPKPQVRRQAVLKLGNVGDDDPEAAKALSYSLNDRDVLVRRDAVHAIVKLKRPNEQIVARLQEMNRADPDATVRDFAKRALAKLGATE